MTYPTRDHEELLRRALHTAAESVEPAGDGLERICARLSPPCLPVAASDIPARTGLPEGIKMTAVSAGCVLANHHGAPEENAESLTSPPDPDPQAGGNNRLRALTAVQVALDRRDNGGDAGATRARCRCVRR